MAKRPPSSWTMGRRSGGMTGMLSRTIDSGAVPVMRKALMTFRRLMARVLRWPEPPATTSARAAASPSRSKVRRRAWMASAPMAPLK